MKASFNHNVLTSLKRNDKDVSSRVRMGLGHGRTVFSMTDLLHPPKIWFTRQSCTRSTLLPFRAATEPVYCESLGWILVCPKPKETEISGDLVILCPLGHATDQAREDAHDRSAQGEVFHDHFAQGQGRRLILLLRLVAPMSGRTTAFETGYHTLPAPFYWQLSAAGIPVFRAVELSDL